MATLVSIIRDNWADLPSWLQHGIVFFLAGALGVLEEARDAASFDWHAVLRAGVKGAVTGAGGTALFRLTPPSKPVAPDPPKQ